MQLSQSEPFNRFAPWITVLGLIGFAAFIFIPLNTKADHPAPDRLAFEGQTKKPLREVSFCLGQNWGNRLSLRRRQDPSPNMARLTNSVLHYIVDVIDEGSVRQLRAYSRRGEAFNKREIEALDGCLTGKALSLGDPRNR